MLLQDFMANEEIDLQELEDTWQLAIDSILAGDFEEAQGAFLMPFFGIESPDTEEWLQIKMRQCLAENFAAQQALSSPQGALAIARFSQEMFPDDLNYLLQLIVMAVDCQCLELEILTEKELLPLLTEAPMELIDQLLMHQAITKFLGVLGTANIDWISEEFIFAWVRLTLGKSNDLISTILLLARSGSKLGEEQGLPLLRLALLEICLEFCQDADLYFDLRCRMVLAAAKAHCYSRAVELAEECSLESNQRSLADQVSASYGLFATLMEAGQWQDIPAAAKQHTDNLNALIDFHPKSEDVPVLGTLISASNSLNYLVDEPRQLHGIRNQMGVICSEIVRERIGSQLELTEDSRQGDSDQKVLRIGYIASTLDRHSVGWLSRGLFTNYNQQEFQVFLYNINQNKENEFHQKHFASQVHISHYFSGGTADIVRQIREDRIDILVDLDSLTLTTTYEVMCCKPAPIQVTWLGWDTSGCPEVDYFIADPYVLPDDAEDYYHSKIWRLPQSYLAIDGFEMGIPTKRRSDHGIPDDGIVYLCAQKSIKHNPDVLRLQMQIIKEVPNSYLLVKRSGDRDALVNTYIKIAAQVGISMDRIKFLERDPDEQTHRANLNIADVVLDTFPYNGATTTLETLWAGVPMVTKVGQAFVARNSYAFMTNAGLTEGIAYSDEEYVAWGIKLGTDLELREQVSGKLIQSRKTSSLWNAKQFTLEMENAYRKMWGIHQKSLHVQGSEGFRRPVSSEPIRLHIGGQVSHSDWKIFDALPRPEVDFLGNAKDLSQFADGSITAIYASHVLEHFYYLLDNELLLTLKEWHRALQPGGELMISVPNLQVICGLYADSRTPPNARHHLMRMIFGGQIDQYDVHKVGFDSDTLSMYLQQAGFQDVQVVPAFGLFPDCSSLEFAGVPISLNMIAKK
jgi:predicted O-linked N-acetylglucosamine transferase (SPINDLY family)/predicted SAM-dependent methyltransferase